MISNNGRIFIVAELSANHGGDLEIAKRSIAKAKEIGCDAVKIQTLRPDLITIECDSPYFKVDTGTIWDGTTLFDLYSRTYLPWEWHRELFDYAAKEVGITLFSSPFDRTAVDLLEDCGNPIYKIASFEITDVPLVKYAASTGKPMVISTGIATEEEILDAVDACRMAGNADVTLLKCTSQYPASPEDANLLTMIDMRERFGTDVGLSDHTEGLWTAAAAAAMGARLIEKHFILDKSIGGADASFSMEPEDFRAMIEAIRTMEKVRGEVRYATGDSDSYADRSGGNENDSENYSDRSGDRSGDNGNDSENDSNRSIETDSLIQSGATDARKQNGATDMGVQASRKYRRSLFVVEDVKEGDLVTEQNVRSIRPGAGLPPKRYEEALGKRFAHDFPKGTPLSEEMLRRS